MKWLAELDTYSMANLNELKIETRQQVTFHSGW